MVKLSVCLPTSAGGSALTASTNFAELEQFTLAAERLGYSSAFVPDRFTQGEAGGGFEPWMFLGALAQQTSRIRLGVLAAQVAYRNPAFVAKMAGTLDYLSGGRLDLGISAGDSQAEHEAYGFDWGGSEEQRQARLDEALTVMKSLFTNSRTTFAGNFYRLNDATCEPSPLQKPWPPVWAVGDDAESLRTAAAHADAWASGPVTPDEYAKALSELEARCSEAGREYASIEKAIETSALVLDGPESEQALLAWARAQGLVQPQAGADEALRALKETLIIGSRQECFERIGQYVSAGAQHIALRFLDYPQTGTMELFATELLSQPS